MKGPPKQLKTPLEETGRRERKRRETSQRIAQTALRLFLSQGYDAVTLKDIAVAAGISRRTFFSYFKSKEDLLLVWYEGVGDQICRALEAQARDLEPLEAMRRSLLAVARSYGSDQAIAIDRLMRSSPVLMNGKQASYQKMEVTVLGALCERWPQLRRRPALRVVAMLSIGSFRLALELWSDAGGRRPVAEFLSEVFESFSTAVR